MTTIRSFIAIELPNEIKNKISELLHKIKQTRADVKWVNPQSIHLTLKFLGNIETGKIEDILSGIKNSSEGIKPFSVEINSISAFPKPEYPRVVWIGINEKTGTLLTLSQKMEENLSYLGFEKEERSFKPHLTLGRVKSQKRKEQLLSFIIQSKDLSLGMFSVTEISLMQSILKPSGAEYSCLGRVGLK